MAFSSRKILMMQYLPKENFTFSITCCDLFFPSSPLPPPPSAYVFSDDDSGKQGGYNIITVLIRASVGGLLLAFVVALAFCAGKRSRPSSATVSGDTTGQEDEEEERDFFHGNGGNLVDHHVWHIPTVGLQRSVIDSITVFRFKKSDGLIDGTDQCSVCLNDFQEDEELRLLPKCTHAFHINCIDAWLNSHKNCPLCRAPIILNQIQIPSDSFLIEMNSNEPRWSSEPRREEARSSTTIEAGSGAETDKEDRFNSCGSRNPNFPWRTLSDLGSHGRRATLESVRRCYSTGSSIQRVCDETTRRPFHFFSVKSRSLRIFRPTRGSDPESSGSG